MSREKILNSLRGKFKAKGLLKALMSEKEKETESLKDSHDRTNLSSPWNEIITQTQLLGFEIPHPTRFLANSSKAVVDFPLNQLNAMRG
jgi:hypothetical protein